MKSKILFGLYFLIWASFLVLAVLYFTDKYYQASIIFGRIVGIITLTVTATTLLTLIIIYKYKLDRRIRIKKTIIICLTPIILLIPLTILYLIPNKLDSNALTIRITHIDWACECADWVTVSDFNKSDSTGRLEDYCFFIEPANKGLTLPDTIGYSGDIIELTGQFYKNKSFPKGYTLREMSTDKARVFRYTNYKIIVSNHRQTIEAINK
jgi:hypothetical protein